MLAYKIKTMEADEHSEAVVSRAAHLCSDKEPPVKILRKDDADSESKNVPVPEPGTTNSDLTQNSSKEGLSKSQLKKLAKKEKWQKYKEFRRAKEKERTREKRLAAKQNNISLGPTRKELKNAKMSTSQCKISIVIDLSFDDLMDDRSLSKCNKQLLHCYSLNRRAANPMQLYFTSMTGKSRKEMDKHAGYSNWDVHITDQSFLDVLGAERVVYLSSESDNELQQLEQDKAYIIGGLVDHNAHKGHCLDVARRLGVNHARLPISQFLDMSTRQVLTIDHVFSVLLHVSEGRSWKEALLAVLPARKQAREKQEEQDEVQDQEQLTLEQSDNPDSCNTPVS